MMLIRKDWDSNTVLAKDASTKDDYWFDIYDGFVIDYLHIELLSQ